MRKKGLILTIAIVFLTGCGANISTDNGTAPQKEHDAAAQYLSGEYGIPVSEDKPKVILDCDMTYMGVTLWPCASLSRRTLWD